MNSKNRILVILSLFLFPTVLRAQPDELKMIDVPYTEVVLDNGLTVIVHEDHKQPIVAVNIWYHVGSKNEPKGKNGFAHLFEHLMFQGSENYNHDFLNAMEKFGATDLNGTTNEDRTNYFENVPSTALDTALFMESDRMGHFVNAISQAKLDEQRKVVLNEKRQGENRPYWGIAEELISKSAFPQGHPYSWTTIGSAEDLNAASLDDVKNWFNTFYGPNNATLTVVGDVKTSEAIEKVKKYFGDIPPGPRISRMTEWIAKRTETKRETVQDRVPFSKLLKIWNVPGIASPELNALDVVSDVFSVGKSSRLYKDIVYDQQLATDISAYLATNEIASLFFIDATAKQGVSLEKLETAINKSLQNFMDHGPTSEEVRRSNAQFKVNFVNSLEKIGGFGGKANLLASNQVYEGSPDAYKEDYLYRLNLKPVDVQNAAKKWLSSGDYNLSITPFPNFQKATSSINRKSMPVPTSYPQAHFPKIQEAKLSNGMRVLLAQRTHIPEVTMNFLIQTGFSHDRKEKLGTSSLVFALLDEGTTKHTLFQISNMLADLGSNLGGFSGMNYSGLYLKSLKANLDPTMSLLSEVILSPAFPQKEIDRVKKEAMEGIQQEKTSPAGIVSRVFPVLLFGKNHPYGVPLSGSGYESTIPSITRNDIVDFYETWAKPGNTIAIVTGDISLKELTALLEKHLRGWKPGKVPPFQIPEIKKELQAGKMFLIDRPGAPQTAIYAGQFAPYFDDPKIISHSIMNDIFGGTFSSRINLNLREDKGWSYGSRSSYVDLQGKQYWLVRAPVQTDKTVQAVQEIGNEIFQFVTQTRPITTEEFNNQKSARILGLPGSWETNESLIGPIEVLLFGNLGLDFYETYPSKLQKLTLPEVVASAKSVIHRENMIWLLIGDQAKILPELQKAGFGPIQILDADGNPK